MFFAPSKSRQRANIWNMGVSKTSYHIQIKIKMTNLSQEPPASFKAFNEDLKEVNVLFTFQINIESQNLDHGCFKVSDCILIKIEIPNVIQKAP